MTRRISELLLLFLSALPLVWAIGVIVFAFRVRLYLGYWPQPHNPEPQFIPFALHNGILSLGLYIVFWGGVLVLLALPLKNRLKLRLPRLLLACGWLMILAMAFVPKIDFVHWFLD